FAAAVETQLLVLVLPELLRRADVESAAGELVDLVLEPGKPLREIAAETAELLAVDLDTEVLHAREDADERPLHRFVERDHALFDLSPFEQTVMPELELNDLVGIVDG